LTAASAHISVEFNPKIPQTCFTYEAASYHKATSNNEPLETFISPLKKITASVHHEYYWITTVSGK